MIVEGGSKPFYVWGRRGFMVRIFLLYALFAAVFPVGKIALGAGSPLALVSIRMTVAGSLMILYSFLFKKESLRGITLKMAGKSNRSRV
ncbi:MAG: hypothetical protein ACQEP8_01280 [Chlamydiota bacterium]